MKKKNVLYRIFVIVIASIMIASACLVVVSFFIPAGESESEDSRGNLTEEEYAQKLADENPMALKALTYIKGQKNTTRFMLTHGRIGVCKKISQMIVGTDGRYYVKLEYANVEGGDNIVLTYYGKGNGSVVSADLYDSKLSDYRFSSNASDIYADGEIDENKEASKLERHIEGEDLEILLKYWRGEYNNDGTDNM